MDERIFTARLRKASVAVFLATGEESVARDLSKMLKGAADEIDNLRAERDKLHSTVRTVLDTHIWDVSSLEKIGKISLEGFVLLVEAVDEAEYCDEMSTEAV